jgi:hypothetical protein
VNGTDGRGGGIHGVFSRGSFACLCVLPLCVVLLRTLPFLAVTRFAPRDAAVEYIPLGYNPKDLLSYIAFQRQLAEDGRWIWANPFTTEPQSGRFVLGLHALLGAVSRSTGLDSFVVLELSRLPLTIAFFAAVWSFTALVLGEERHRIWACWLIGLSGGFDWLARLATGLFPETLASSLAQDLWHLQGWSTFAAMYNPLWIAGLTLTLLSIRIVLRPSTPRGSDAVALAVTFFVLYWVHPYSAVVVLTVFATRALLGGTFGRAPDRRRFLTVVLSLAAPLVVIGAIALWQARDPVFRSSSGGFFGSQYVSALWYPVTLGVLGPFAWLGLRRRLETGDAWGHELAGWLVAVVFLHNSPILNGYHFLFHLHLPVAILAAPIAAEAYRAARDGPRWRGVATGCLLGALFLATPAVTIESILDTREGNRVPVSYAEMIRFLDDQPPGNVLASSFLGNLIPAYTHHRVYVGQWFLTPDHDLRAARYDALVARPGNPERLRRLIDAEEIGYVVAPTREAERLGGVLAPRFREAFRTDRLVLFVLDDRDGEERSR